MRIIFIIVFGLTVVSASAQSAEQAFHMASGQYIHGKMPEARNTLDNALMKYPTDEKLRALREKIKEDEHQEQKNKDQENKEDKDQKDKGKDQKEQDQKNKDNKDQKGEDNKQDQKSQEQKDKDQKEKQEQQKKDEQVNPEEGKKDEKQEQNPSFSEKLEQMKISEEKAKMILEAMKNQEMQYLQQQRRKASKPKDKSKPDW